MEKEQFFDRKISNLVSFIETSSLPVPRKVTKNVILLTFMFVQTSEIKITWLWSPLYDLLVIWEKWKGWRDQGLSLTVPQDSTTRGVINRFVNRSRAVIITTVQIISHKPDDNFIKL